MASQESLVLYAPVDPRDLGPGHVDLHLFSAEAAAENRNQSLLATIPVGSADGIVPVHLKHPVHEAVPLVVAPGMISLGNAQRATLSLFCMGGQADLHCESELSVVSITSGAPILLFSKSMYDDDLDPVDLTADELEAWLSILRARARGKVAAFERALLRIPPFQLYAQGLVLAARRMGELAVDERSEFFWRSYNTLNAALKAAKQRPNFPNPMPNFEALLSV